GGARDREQAENERVLAADVPVAVLAPGPDERHGHDRQQRGRLGVVLVEADEEHEARHEQHAAADAEQAGDDAAGEPDRDRADHRSTSSTALASRTAANSSEIARSETRWASQVPSSTPAAAGIPTRAALSTSTFPYSPWTAAANAAM